MREHLAEGLRRRVAERACFCCEYCRIHEEDTHFGCQVDHVLSLKHGGTSDESNLAYACALCNRCKGTDVGSVDEKTGLYVRLFNPRADQWEDHFRLRGVFVEPRTAVGRVTARLLQLNAGRRLLERELLASVGRYPPGTE